MLAGQFISGIAIILLAVLAFYKQMFRFELRTLVKVSLLTLLSVILAIFSWMIPIMGFPALKIGLSQLPLIIVGYLYGLPYAFIAGLSSDVIELLSGNIMTPFFGFTLNKILIAMIPAYWAKGQKKGKAIFFILSLSLVLSAALLYIFSLDEISSAGSLQSLSMVNKGLLSLILISLSIGLSLWVLKMRDNFHDLNVLAFAQAVLWVEVIVNLGLTPLWLFAMYGLPIDLSIFARLIKTVVMIPLHVILGLILLRLLTKLKV